MAAYPYYYPAQYNYQPTLQNVGQNVGNVGTNGIIWVQGEAGAKSYLVAPNTTVQLWDSEGQTIYLKSADASGMPSIKILDYTIRDNPTQPRESVPVMTYATMDDINLLKAEIKRIKEALSNVREHESDAAAV